MMNSISFVYLNDEEAEACCCKGLGDGTSISTEMVLMGL